MKTIIVTGASRGLGLAIAEYILREGHNVILVARSRDSLEEICGRYPKQARSIAGDLSDFSLAKKVTDLATEEFGQIDGLVINHAIVGPLSKVADINIEVWKSGFDINFLSAVVLVVATLPELRKTKGCIVMTSSGAGKNSYKSMGFYGASKAALMHLGQTIGVEEPDVTTLNIAPGVVDTQMQQDIRDGAATMDKEEHEKFSNLHKNGQLLKPELPGNVMAKVVLNSPKDLSGKYLRWDAPELASFK